MMTSTTTTTRPELSIKVTSAVRMVNGKKVTVTEKTVSWLFFSFPFSFERSGSRTVLWRPHVQSRTAQAQAQVGDAMDSEAIERYV